MSEGSQVGCGVKRSMFRTVVLKIINLFLFSVIFYLNVININVSRVIGE